MCPSEVGAAVPEESATSIDQDAGTAERAGVDGAGKGVRDDIRSYLNAVFGETTGFAVFALGMNPYCDPRTGKYKHSVWSERNDNRIAFSWPEGAEEICDAIEQFADRGDLYVTPYVRRSNVRAKGDAVILQLVHTDGDNGLDEEKIAALTALGAFVVGSGTPGNGHVYVPLSEPVSQAEHEALCKGLIAYLDGDKAKHSDNDLLRPVGAYNFKSTVFENRPARQVRWVIKPNGQRVDPRTLADLLGVDLDHPHPKHSDVSAGGNGQAGNVGFGEAEPFDLGKYPQVADALMVVSDPPDRSRDLHRVVRATYDVGLTVAQAMWAVQQRADLAERLDEHPEDVGRSWAKIDGQQRLARTDKGNATMLAAEYSPSIRFVPEVGKWMHWNGLLWHIDPDTGPIDTAAGKIATELPGNSRLDRAHRKRSLSASGITAMVRLARSDPMMRVCRDRLDSNGWQLNTPNGIVDLRSGDIGDHRSAAWHTRIAGVGCDSRDDCPIWKHFLDITFEGDSELISYVQGLFGYAAIGEVLSHILPFFWGGGNNGKSVLLEVVSRILGDYAIAAPANFLLAGRDKHETEIARLSGARLVVCSEINPGARFDEAKVKLLTGGDTLTGRFMHGNFFDFRPSHMLFVVGNHQPKVEAGGHAFWRRVRLVPFTHLVREEERIEGLADQLIEAEGPAILGWIVAGTRMVAAGELVTPERVLAATEEYAESEDRIKQFLDDCTTCGTCEDRELVGAVYQRYVEWCQAHRNMDVLEDSVFGRELSSRGFQKRKSNNKRYVHGLKLNVPNVLTQGW